MAPPVASQDIPNTLATSQTSRTSSPPPALSSPLLGSKLISSTLEGTLATSSPSSTTPSIYVTCKVLSIVNAFRKKITRHVQERRPTSVARAKTSQAFCRDFEREAYRKIDHYLGKKTLLPRKAGKPGLLDDKEESRPAGHYHRLLSQVNDAFDYNGNNLGTIAEDNRLFLDRKAHFDVGPHSLKQLCELLISVKDLCQIANTCEGLHTIAGNGEVSSQDFDVIFIANLLHLLLCLQSLLITALLEKCIGKLRNHAEQCHRDQAPQKFWRCERWSFEYPDGKRPVSTTWPWCLRPSLAVLWGVCWMFYDRPTGYNFDAAGNLLLPDGQVIPQTAWTQGRRYFNQWQGLATQVPSLSAQRSAELGFNHSQVAINPVHGHTEWQPNAMFQARHVPAEPLGRTGFRGVAQRHLNFQAARTTAFLPPSNHTHLAHDSKPQGVYANQDRGAPGTNNNAYTSAPPSQALLPQSSTRPSFPSGTHRSWPQEGISGYRNSSFAHTAPPGGRLNSPPSQNPARHLRPSPQPQNNAFSPASSYGSSPQDAFSANYLPFYIAPNQGTYFDFMAAIEPAPINGHPQPDTPMTGDPSDNTDPQLQPRKRSYDEMNNELPMPEIHQVGPQPYPALPPQHEQQQQPLDHVEPEQHETELEQGETQHEEGFEPRGSRSFKRGDPPVTTEGKFFCDYASECAGQFFDRKCEWSKHMDKHDRPYRCQHAQCAKLQGFTYSGGLLRHEREVHGKHGGPKAQLMCPYNECKRHTGKGFTRKENLNEHLRRVHDGKKPEEEPDANAAFQAGLEEAIRQTDMNQAVSGATHETALPYPAPENQQYPAETAEMVKRRRIEDEPAGPSDDNELRNEITRLQIESAQKDERIRQMETREAELATRLHHLEQEAGRVRQLEDMLRIHEAVRQVIPAAEEARMQKAEGVV